MKTYCTPKIFTWLFLLILLFPNFANAQRGNGGMRRSPAQMVAAEKSIMYDSLSTLNDDQKMIIEQIYTDYEQAIEEARGNADPNNRESMRDAMTSIRKGKDESLKAILTEDQFLKFEAILKVRRDEMMKKRGNRDQ